jgi:hypothetical protein
MPDEEFKLEETTGPSSPMIEVGMPHKLVVSLLGAAAFQRLERAQDRARSNEVFVHSAGKYEILFDKNVVVEVRSQPPNVEKLPTKVIAALLGSPIGASTKARSVEVAATLERTTWRQVLLTWVVVIAVIVAACFIPYAATAVQVLAIVFGAIPVIWIGIMASPIGWIYLGIQFFTVLMGGPADREESDEPFPTVSQFVLGQIMLGVYALMAFVIAIVVFIAADPVGGMSRYVNRVREIGRAEERRLEALAAQRDREAAVEDSASSKEEASDDAVANVNDPEQRRFQNAPAENSSNANSKESYGESVSREEAQGRVEEATERPPIREQTTSQTEDPRKIIRSWRDNTGAFEIEAKCLDFNGAMVTLEKADGKTAEVKVERLSKEDLQWLSEHFPTASKP